MIYDITQELFTCEVYPGDPAPRSERLASLAQGDVCNLTAFSMCAHNGTHLDAPAHFIPDGKTVDQIGPERCFGPAYVAEHQGPLHAEDARRIMVRAATGGAGERILLKGDLVVMEDAAEIFAAAGIFLLGNESQTVGPSDAPARVHRILLGADVVLLEGIRLAQVPEGAYLLSALPLNLGGSDGAPCRAVLWDGQG
ncbi:MAG: cyclase family protein [Oscillospiraceae bacterium]|nr:cyclase family protein [Oscillospiraceae bacterium]